MVLHLATVILFQQSTNCAIHIPGKMVPQVISFLQGCIQTEHHSKLLLFERLVIQQHRLSTQVDKQNQTEKNSVAESTAPKVGNVAVEHDVHDEAGFLESEEVATRVTDLSRLEQQLFSLLNDIKTLTRVRK